MSRLSDLVNEVVLLSAGETGAADVHAAAKSARERLNDNDVETLVSEALIARCKAAAERLVKSARKQAERSAQLSMFPALRRGYALDTDGRVVKATEALTEMEFERLIAIREKSIADDQAHLRALRDARDEAKPIWKKHPRFTFGQCCAALAVRAPRRPRSLEVVS